MEVEDIMWVLFAFLSAFFAGLTSILAKCGIKKTDSTVATALRTIVVLFFSFVMVMIVGSVKDFSSISSMTLLFLILSGLSTGASWLCYFKALQKGNINKVVPIDKSSTIMTVLLAFLVLGESIGVWKGIGTLVMALGTFMMIEKKEGDEKEGERGWFICALLSAVFASLTSILGKIGISGVESNLGTFIRTIVVLVMSTVMVAVTGKMGEVKRIERRELGFIILSGFATGASWLCYYKALQDGEASIVVPIDKLSILFTVTLSYFVFGEKLKRKSFLGLILLVGGTLMMLIR